jgi:uncharacterized membrane protein HdeD (DUF308 family)
VPETVKPSYLLHYMGVLLIVYSLVLIFHYSKTTLGTKNVIGGYGRGRVKASQEAWEVGQKIAGRWIFVYGVIEIVIGFITNVISPTFNGLMFQVGFSYLSIPLCMIGIEIHMRKKFSEEGKRE